MSCAEYRDENIPASGLAWHHHDEVGHYEDITEDVIEVHAICNGCGKDFGPGEEGVNAAGEHVMSSDTCADYRSERRKVGSEVVDKK